MSGGWRSRPQDGAPATTCPLVICAVQHKLCSAASSVAYRCCSPPWAFPPKLGPLSGAAPFGGQPIISHPFAGWPAVMAAFCSCRLKETHMPAPLLSLAEDTALLALAAAGTEAQRMVTEKVSAFAEAAPLLASGGSANEVVKGYRAGQALDGVAVVNGSVNVLEVKRRMLRSETAQV